MGRREATARGFFSFGMILPYPPQIDNSWKLDLRALEFNVTPLPIFDMLAQLFLGLALPRGEVII